MSGPNDDIDDDGPDAEFMKEIGEAIDKAFDIDGEKDAGGFDAPLDDVKAAETVSAEDGNDLATNARFRDAQGKFAKDLDKGPDGAEDADKKTDTKDGDAAKAAVDVTKEKADADPDKGDDGANAEDGKSSEPVDLAKASVGDLLNGIDEGKAKEIAKRLGASAQVMDLFAGREDQLRIHGLSEPHEAIKRLLYLNEFAQQKPDEYIAWVAQQIGPDKSQAALEGAAKRLGYKLVKDEPDVDEFADEETKRLAAENAELRRKSADPFGPDAPQYQTVQNTRDQLSSFINERDDTGSLKRPHYQTLAPRMTQLAKHHVETTKQYVTPADLQRFYDQSLAEARSMFAPGDTPAAQPATPVQQPEQTTAAQPQTPAKPAEKAASKMIDGDGPGATRRPALPKDADLRSAIEYFANLE